MQFLHTMVRVTDLEKSMHFYCDLLGLTEYKRLDYPDAKFSLIYLAAPADTASAQEKEAPLLELTYNWDSSETYQSGRNFGHIAFLVDDIYQTCEFLSQNGVVIHRPPRDGYMAFIKSPDNISIELLQKGETLAPKEPWVSMENIGTW